MDLGGEDLVTIIRSEIGTWRYRRQRAFRRGESDLFLELNLPKSCGNVLLSTLDLDKITRDRSTRELLVEIIQNTARRAKLKHLRRALFLVNDSISRHTARLREEGVPDDDDSIEPPVTRPASKPLN